MAFDVWMKDVLQDVFKEIDKFGTESKYIRSFNLKLIKPVRSGYEQC